MAETLAVVECFGHAAGQHLQQYAAEHNARLAGPAVVVGYAGTAGKQLQRRLRRDRGFAVRIDRASGRAVWNAGDGFHGGAVRRPGDELRHCDAQRTVRRGASRLRCSGGDALLSDRGNGGALRRDEPVCVGGRRTGSDDVGSPGDGGELLQSQLSGLGRSDADSDALRFRAADGRDGGPLRRCGGERLHGRGSGRRLESGHALSHRQSLRCTDVDDARFAVCPHVAVAVRRHDGAGQRFGNVHLQRRRKGPDEHVRDDDGQHGLSGRRQCGSSRRRHGSDHSGPRAVSSGQHGHGAEHVAHVERRPVVEFDDAEPLCGSRHDAEQLRTEHGLSELVAVSVDLDAITVAVRA
jgi:hypothetical protein